MRSYSARAGDTFESLARKLYGSEQEADRLRYANPQITEPIPEGAQITYAPTSIESKTPAADSPDRVELRLNGGIFRYWESVAITRSLDSVDVIEISAPFDPTDAAQRAAFRPFSFQSVEALIGGVRLFSGTIVQVSPQSGANASRVRLVGYALAGVLANCTPPPNLPLEFNGWTLDRIAAELCRPFGVAVSFEAEAGPAFDRIKCARTDRVLEFLADLGRQRGGVWASRPDGGLTFRKSSDAGTPVASLKEFEAPVEAVTTDFDGQNYFSQVSGFEPIGTGSRGSIYTVNNPRVKAVRPHTFTVTDAIGGDVKTATEAAMGRMFGSAAPYAVSLATWRTPSGELWAPDMTVSLLAPRAMVYSPYKFKVRRAVLRADSDTKTAALELMLPGCLAGEIPESLPWD